MSEARINSGSLGRRPFSCRRVGVNSLLGSRGSRAIPTWANRQMLHLASVLRSSACRESCGSLGPLGWAQSWQSFHMKFSFRGGGRALARLARLGCAVRLLALRPPRPPCFPTGAPLALCRASGHHHYGRTGAGAPWTSELSTTTAPGCRELHAALETC